MAPQLVFFLAVFIAGVLTGPFLIKWFKKLKFGQTVRPEGPKTHLKKTGTPTIGGLIFIIPIAVIGVIASYQYPEIWPLLLLTISFGLIGFIDDYLKVKKRSKDGLSVMQKTVLELIAATGYAIYMVVESKGNYVFNIPLIEINVPVWLFALLIIITIYATTNAVNFGDGIDGLLGSMMFVIMAMFAIFFTLKGSFNEIGIFASMVAGGCLAFLVYNFHPAKVFMGDSGSLALGGAFVGCMLTIRAPGLIFICGIIFVVEILSVAIQVSYYKRTKKRVFKMAPIHHHFELSNWSEWKVVGVFTLITLIGSVITYVIMSFTY